MPAIYRFDRRRLIYLRSESSRAAYDVLQRGGVRWRRPDFTRGRDDAQG